jgi:acetoin utilization protein AcuC
VTVNSLGLLNLPNTALVEPKSLSRDIMEKFHTADYLDVLQRAGRGVHDFKALKKGLGTPDCPLFKDMYEYISLAAGGTVTAAELILSGEADIAFNPSGGFHHASSDSSSGFCYINDLVLGAMTLAEAKKRVMIIDLDAHHGDGTQAAFYSRPDVITLSMHESGKTLFPGTGFVEEIGEGDGKGYCINLPLPVGTYDAIYYSAFREIVPPLVEATDPDVLMVALGMDALAGDPLAHLHLTNNIFADIVADLVEMNKPIVATGGGGYNTRNTVRSWSLIWSVFANGRDDSMAALGMGGVMLENTAWFGGLRDRTLLSHGGFRDSVDKEIRETVDKLKAIIFPLHGL